MNSGVIALRYAKALLKYVRGESEEDIVYSQACRLVSLLDAVPQFRNTLQHNPDLTVDGMVSLLEAALEDSLCGGLRRFVALVDSHSRMEYFHRMLTAFIDVYRDAVGIKVGSLTTAVPMEGLCDRLETLMSGKMQAKVLLQENVDESLTGGFVLQVGDCRVDASVAGQFRKIRKALIEKDNRII